MARLIQHGQQRRARQTGSCCATRTGGRSPAAAMTTCGPHATATEIIKLKAEFGFFHWHLEFPEVFRVPDEVDPMVAPILAGPEVSTASFATRRGTKSTSRTRGTA